MPIPLSVCRSYGVSFGARSGEEKKWKTRGHCEGQLGTRHERRRLSRKRDHPNFFIPKMPSSSPLNHHYATHATPLCVTQHEFSLVMYTYTLSCERSLQEHPEWQTGNCSKPKGPLLLSPTQLQKIFPVLFFSVTSIYIYIYIWKTLSGEAVRKIKGHGNKIGSSSSAWTSLPLFLSPKDFFFFFLLRHLLLLPPPPPPLLRCIGRF